MIRYNSYDVIPIVLLSLLVAWLFMRVHVLEVKCDRLDKYQMSILENQRDIAECVRLALERIKERGDGQH